MRRLLAVIATSMFAASAAIADDAHEHSAQPAKPAANAMHEHMKTMQQQMAQIRAATDPKEKERLMHEHMKSMEQSMSKMQGTMGCGKM